MDTIRIKEFLKSAAEALKKETNDINDSLEYVPDVIADCMERFNVPEKEREEVRKFTEEALREAWTNKDA